MKRNGYFVTRFNIFLLGFTLAMGVFTASAEIQSGEIIVKSVQGAVTVCSDHSTWSAVTPEMVLGKGAVIKTSSDSSADLIFAYSGTVLRMTAGTVLELTKLDKEIAGQSTIVDTTVTLKSGSVMGSQRKLAKPSRFEIQAPWGVATIHGTEYLVSADGRVACYSGEVAVTRNSDSGVKAAVPAGHSIDAAGAQVLIGPAHMETVALDLATVRANAKASVGKSNGNNNNSNNGKGNDNNGKGNDNNGKGNDNGNGNNNGKGNGNGNGNGIGNGNGNGNGNGKGDGDNDCDDDHEPPVSQHHGHGNGHGHDNDHGHGHDDHGHDNHGHDDHGFGYDDHGHDGH